MEIEYLWHHDENGDLDVCDACGSEVPTAAFPFMDMRRRDEKKRLCEICASSHVGSTVEYAREDSRILQTMAQIANQVLLKLGAFPKGGNGSE